MIVDSYATNLHEVKQKLLRWLPIQIANDEWVGLDIGYELLLLFQDVLKILKVAVRILLVLEFAYQSLFWKLSQTFEVIPQFIVAKYGLYCFTENSYSSDCWK